MSIAKNIIPSIAEQLIYNTLRAGGIPDPLAKFVTAQSGHETQGWTSAVWYKDNNGFGYGYDGKGNYKYYDSIEESADELVRYLNRRVDRGDFPALASITDPDQYAQLLKNAGYYGDTESNYSNGILRWFNNNLQFVEGAAGIIIIFVTLLLFFLNNERSSSIHRKNFI